MTDLELIERLLLSAFLGAALGFEREWRQKYAGLRTNILIAIGSTLFTVMSIDLSSGSNGDPTRVAAQIVTGIGFLGAGAIMRTGADVRGLTTAATIDCGVGGALKPRWMPGSVEAMATATPLAPPQLTRRPALPPTMRQRDAIATLSRIDANLSVVRDVLADGLACRAGHAVKPGALERHASDLLSWSADEKLRVAIQELLGCSFLPRLWRTGIDLDLGPALWRPLVLAAHEILGQADRLQRVAGADATSLAQVDALRVAS